jgi:hypothetical protein
MKIVSHQNEDIFHPYFPVRFREILTIIWKDMSTFNIQTFLKRAAPLYLQFNPNYNGLLSISKFLVMIYKEFSFVSLKSKEQNLEEGKLKGVSLVFSNSVPENN